MPAAYGEDLAYIHHAGFGFFAEEQALKLLALLRGAKAKTVVDLGCGSGIVAKHLSRAGFAVTGIDQSPAMIRLAKQNAPQAKFRVGSYGSPLPRADAVVAVGEVFNYGRANLLPIFRRIKKALGPHGLFTFDFAGPGRAAQGKSKSFTLGADWAVLVKRHEAGRNLTRRITSFVKRGALYRRSDEQHHLTLYTPAAMLALLRQAGFTAHLRAAHAPGHYAVLAKVP